jgi:hypothetical protein
MANTHDSYLYPLEGFASSGKKYGATSDTQSVLQPLTGTGGEYEHSDANFSLPSLSLAATGAGGYTARSAFSLPKLGATIYMGHHAAFSLPALTGSSGVTVFPVAHASFELPSLTASSTVLAGTTSKARFSLPSMTVSMTFGGHSSFALPSLTLTAQVWAMESSNADLDLPSLRCSATSSVYSSPTFVAIALPALQAGPYGDARVELPSLFLVSTAEVSDDGAYEGWVMNMRSGGVTRVTAWPFKQLVRCGDRLFAVGPTGLCLVGGDTDNGTAIPWEFETGLSDLGSPGLKFVPYLLMDGIIEGRIKIEVIDDDAKRYDYNYESRTGPLHNPHRRILGRGIRTRNVAFNLSSTYGAHLELDALEPEFTVSQRSV